jgi:putative ABC transport system substrate-binding protein
MIEYRGAEGQIERIPDLVKELVALKVDILVLATTNAIRTAKEATQTIPIVMVAGLDPVAMGLVDSLARPGGNITGISTLSQDLNGKRLELLKEAVPKLSRVGILFHVEAQSSCRRGSNSVCFGDFDSEYDMAKGARVTLLD